MGQEQIEDRFSDRFLGGDLVLEGFAGLQLRGGRIVELMDQIEFPVVQRTGSHCSKVSAGKERQELQPLERSDLLSELYGRRELGQIEAKGRQGHDQVLVDQKADQFSIRFAQAEDLGGFIGDAQPYFGVIFDEAFSEIVQEQGQVQDEFLFGFPVEVT